MRRKIIQKLRRIKFRSNFKIRDQIPLPFIFLACRRLLLATDISTKFRRCLYFPDRIACSGSARFFEFLIFCRCRIYPIYCCDYCRIRLCCMAIYRSCALYWACATSASIFCRFARRFVRSLLSGLATSHLLAYAADGAVLARYARVASSRKATRLK